MPTVKNINNLIINRVESKEVYDNLVETDRVNSDELYLIEGDDSYIFDVLLNGDSVVNDERIAEIIVDKASVGLGNVDNTADMDKPISKSVQSALDKKMSIDDIVEGDNINIDKSGNKATISLPLDIEVFGNTQDDSITVKDGGITTDKIANKSITIDKIGDGVIPTVPDVSGFITQEEADGTYAVKNHSHSDATDAVAGFMSADDKAKLDGIEENANNYVLPATSGDSLGGIKSSRYNEQFSNSGHVSLHHVAGRDGELFVRIGKGLTKTTDDTVGVDIDIYDVEGLQDALNSKSNVNHTHDDMYYTEDEVNSLLATKANSAHNHSADQIVSGVLSSERLPSIPVDKLSGVISSFNLPSYVDDVLEYNSQSVFPEAGESGKIYIDKTTNKTYRWSGSSYVEISASLALGTTSSTAFRGDYGNTAYAHAEAKGSAFANGLYKITTNAHGHVTGATAVTKSDIVALGIPGQDTDTTYDNATTSSDGLMSSEDKTKLDGVATGANNYTHPSSAAGAKSSGLYKIATDTSGHIVAATAVTKNDITALGIPAQDTNTTYNIATSSTSGLMSKKDKEKMSSVLWRDERTSNLYIGTDSETPFASAIWMRNEIKGLSLGIGSLEVAFESDVDYDSSAALSLLGSNNCRAGLSAGEKRNTFWLGDKHVSGIVDNIGSDPIGYNLVTDKAVFDAISENVETPITYSLSKSGSAIILKGSDGSSSQVADANTTYTNATISSAGLMSSSDKSKLDGMVELTDDEINDIFSSA